MEYDSRSKRETARIAEMFASAIVRKRRKNMALVIALDGELGAGKTTFAKAFAGTLGVKENITSPTFVLLKKYQITDARYQYLIHVDAYRLKDYTELESLDFKKLCKDPQAIILVEWADRVTEALPKDRITVHMNHINESTRKIQISNSNNK